MHQDNIFHVMCIIGVDNGWCDFQEVILNVFVSVMHESERVEDDVPLFLLAELGKEGQMGDGHLVDLLLVVL